MIQFDDKNSYMSLNVSIKDTFCDNKNLYTIHLQTKEIQHAWDLGYKSAITLAKNKIRLLPAPSRGKTIIILSGGSMQNKKARTEMEDFCNKYKIKCRVVGFNINVESR